MCLINRYITCILWGVRSHLVLECDRGHSLYLLAYREGCRWFCAPTLRLSMSNFYDILQKIKQRPALYLGKRSLSYLQVFLDGYTFARRELAIDVTKQEREFEEFQEWIEQRFNQADTQSWSRIILFYSEDEGDALDRFFELFDKFLQRDDTLEINTINYKHPVTYS